MATAQIDGSVRGLYINGDVKNSIEYQSILSANEAKYGTNSSSARRKTRGATDLAYRQAIVEGDIDPPASAKGSQYKVQHNTPNGIVDATPRNNLTQAEADAALLNYGGNATTTTNSDGTVNVVPGSAQYAKTNTGSWVGTTTNAEGDLVPDTNNAVTETTSNHDANVDGPEVMPRSDLTQDKINKAAEIAGKPKGKTDQELLDAKRTLRAYEKYTEDKKDAVLAENGTPDSYGEDFDGEDNLNDPKWNDASKQAKFDQAWDQYADARGYNNHLSSTREYKNARTNELATEMGVADTSVSADGTKLTASSKSTTVGGVPVVVNGVGVPVELLYDDELANVNSSRSLGASMSGGSYDQWSRGETNPYRDQNTANAIKTNSTVGNNKVVLIPDSDANSAIDSNSNKFLEQDILNSSTDNIIGDNSNAAIATTTITTTRIRTDSRIPDTDTKKLDQTNTDAEKAAIYVLDDDGNSVPRLLSPEEVQQYKRDGRLLKIDRGLLDALITNHLRKVQGQLLSRALGTWPDTHHFIDENLDKNLDINNTNLITSPKKENKFDPFRTPSVDPGVGRGNKISLTIPPSNGDFGFEGHLGILNAEGNRGVAFPYTPTIQITHGANYGTHEITHSVYQPNYFINNPNSTINITAQFTSQNVKEAQYTKAALHFFKAITRMDYGEATRGTTAGTPPPVCFFNGYGSHMFSKNLPVILQSLNYTLLEDTDYVTIDGETVPTQILVSLDLRIQLVPTKVRKEFDINKYRSGELLKNPGGFF